MFRGLRNVEACFAIPFSRKSCFSFFCAFLPLTALGRFCRLRRGLHKIWDGAPTVEKLLCRSFIVSVLKISPCFLRERGDSQEGGNRRCLPSCALRRVGEFRSLRKRKFHDLRRVIVFEQSHAVSRPHTAADESRQTSALPYPNTGGPPAHQSQTAGRLDTASQYINR